jgi:hypothetical protein
MTFLGILSLSELGPLLWCALHQLSQGTKLHFKSPTEKRSTFSASELAGIEPTPPAPEEQGMPALTNWARVGIGVTKLHSSKVAL